jgi:hypothetical protein
LETLDKLIVEENYLSEQIFNMDETSLSGNGFPKGLSSIRRPSQCQVSRFVQVHFDVHTMTKSPDAFFRMYPHC